MTSLDQYTSLIEKDNFFQTGSLAINCIQDFDRVLKYLKDIPQGQFIYRGVNNAKYKLYTTSQRKFITTNTDLGKNQYKEFIINEINNFLSSRYNVLQEFFEKAKISNENFLAFLSIMQHYGHPTPCLDFSDDPLVALFFAFNNSSSLCDTNIDEYVSLYSLSREYSAHYFLDLGLTMFEGFFYRKVFKKDNFDFNLNSRLPFDILFDFDLPICFDVTAKNYFSFKTRNNPRLIKQEGLLLFNPDPNLPLEEVSRKIYSNYKGPDWKEIKCINFHKGLRNHVIKFLDEIGINESTLLDA
jgi:hypothetical protein